MWEQEVLSWAAPGTSHHVEEFGVGSTISDPARHACWIVVAIAVGLVSGAIFWVACCWTLVVRFSMSTLLGGVAIVGVASRRCCLRHRGL